MRHNSLILVAKLTQFALIAVLVAVSACSSGPRQDSRFPSGFVDLAEYFKTRDMSLAIDVRYFSQDNFVGAVIDGYQAAKIILTEEAATNLALAAQQLQTQGLGFKVFDGYRPQLAVDHFVRWAADLADTKMKPKYYPAVDKRNLFRDGYIASRSGHSRGSTVDLTLIEIETNTELDMGTGWDFFDLRSWPSSEEVSSQQKKNRMILRETMISAGFRPLEEEWWHFTLEAEPYPDQYFEFPIQ